MNPPFDPAIGTVPSDLHSAPWPEVVARFGGESFPAEVPADAAGAQLLDPYQRDKWTGEPKGLIAIDLRELP